MKRIGFAFGLCVAAMGAHRIEGKTEQEITVYLVNQVPVPSPLMIRSRAEASRIFARIGIKLHWEEGKPSSVRKEMPDCPADPAIVVTIRLNAPRDFKPGALAFTAIGTGAITVFYDRLRPVFDTWPRLVPTFLAHVMAHEITHCLEDVNRHSETGIMKANWSIEDYHSMEERPLPFTALDIELIRAAVASRLCR